MNITEALRAGVRHDELVALFGSKEAADCALRPYRRKCVVVKGLIKLPPELKDEPLPAKDFAAKGACYCGNAIYRKGAKFCSHKCHSDRQIKPKPQCKMCGNPVRAGNIKYCSRMCRYKSQIGKKPKGAPR